jgi:hypothetical protein
MPYYNGGDLASLIKSRHVVTKRRFGEERVLNLFIQVGVHHTLFCPC